MEPPGRNGCLLLSRDHKHWTGCQVQQAVRHAAQQKSSNRAEPARSHDDQVCAGVP